MCDENVDDVRETVIATPKTFKVSYSSHPPPPAPAPVPAPAALDACLSRMERMDLNAMTHEYEDGLDPQEVFVDMYDVVVAKINDAQYRKLVSWMIGVMDEWGHHEAAVNVAVDLLNRFLYEANLTKGLFQLAGMAAIWIADKLVHVYPNICKEYVVMADETYTKKELQSMEMMMLKTLDWRIMQIPSTSHAFAERRIQQSGAAVDRKLVEYLLCVGFTDQAHMKYAPSVLAEAAVFIANAALANASDFDSMIGAIDLRLTSAVSMLCRVGLLNASKHAKGGSFDIQEKYQSAVMSSATIERLILIESGCAR